MSRGICGQLRYFCGNRLGPYKGSRFLLEVLEGLLPAGAGGAPAGRSAPATPVDVWGSCVWRFSRERTKGLAVLAGAEPHRVCTRVVQLLRICLLALNGREATSLLSGIARYDEPGLSMLWPWARSAWLETAKDAQEDAVKSGNCKNRSYGQLPGGCGRPTLILGQWHFWNSLMGASLKPHRKANRNAEYIVSEAVNPSSTPGRGASGRLWRLLRRRRRR